MMPFAQTKINRCWFASTVAWLVVIFSLSITSSQTVLETVNTVWYGEEFGHIISYTVLMFCTLRAFQKSLPVWVIGLFCFFIGLTIEFLQTMISSRGYEFIDIVSNLVGVVIGYLALLWMESKRRMFS